MRKLKLFMVACALMCVGQMWGQTAWSGDITNADGLAFSKQYVGLSDGDVAETWKTSIDSSDGFDLNQSLSSVPDGVYELSAQAMYRASLTYGTATNCVLYATVGDKEFSTPIANFGDYTSKEDRTATGGIATQMKNNNAYLNVVPAVIVEGGNVTIGMKSIGALTYCTNGYWFVFKKSTFSFKNVTSAYHAKLIARATTILASAPASDAKTTLNDALTTYATANFANVKALQAAINTFLETATVENPLNVTDYIINPSFSDDSNNKKNWIQDLGYQQPSDIYQPTGWNMLYSSAKVTNTQYQTYKTQTANAKDNNCYYVRQRWGDVYAVVDLHQLVKELPSGAYQLKVAVKGGSSVTDANTLKMVAGANSATTTVNDFDKSNYKDYSVQVVKADADTDIDISFGWNQKTGGEQLYYVDDFRLYYLGDPVKAKKNELLALQATIDDDYLDNSTYVNIVGTERTELTSAKSLTAASETVEAYETTIATVQAAIDAFTAAKTNYDALAREITKAEALGYDASEYAATSSSTAATALTATQNIKVAEYNLVKTTYQYGVDLGAWTTTGPTGSLSDQHYKGSGNSYLEQSTAAWGQSSWTIKYDQDVTLPAGNYVFKVAGRQAASDGVTLSLTVKNGETVLGTVNDFPRGDTGLGINTSGATDFTTGEGHEYVNSGNGRGWEWRYVKFTLAADATVNVAVDAVATTSHMWVSFCDASVLTDNEANVSLIAYNIALNSAQTVIADDTYSNVTGSEKTALQTAIDADESLNKSDADAIDAATAALDAAREAFVAAKDAYDTFVAAKAVEYEDNLPYASSTKFAAIGTAQSATATSASDATSKTTAIISAYRKYVESNAMGERVSAEDKTSLISDPNMDVTYDATAHTFGAWQVFNQTDGTISLKTTSDQPLTDGDGNQYKYADIWKSDNNGGIKQTLSNLPAGKYLLTVAGRAQNADGATFVLFAGDKNTPITRMNNTGGVFGNGWNDASLMFYVPEAADVEIGVVSGNGKTMWWGATRFRLARLGDAIENITVSDAGFATYVSDNDLDYYGVTGLKAYKATVSENTITFETVTTVPAGEGVLLRGDGDTYSVPVTAGVAAWGAEENAFIRGTGAAVETGSGPYNYILNKVNGVIGFYRAAGQTVATNRAYLQTTTNAARLNISFDDDDQTTGIARVEETVANNAVYTLSGVRVEKPTKGLYIKNGKKVVIK